MVADCPGQQYDAQGESVIPRGESFVGMNALLDFNWRFATNGIELTEDEFNELVANNRRLVNIR